MHVLQLSFLLCTLQQHTTQLNHHLRAVLYLTGSGARPAAFAELGAALVVVKVDRHEKGEAGVRSLAVTGLFCNLEFMCTKKMWRSKECVSRSLFIQHSCLVNEE